MQFVSFIFMLILEVGLSQLPQFSQQWPYFFEIKEEVSNGTSVGHVNASVLSSDLPVFYEVSGEAAGKISVNNITGELVVIGRIDYDLPSVFDVQFTVYAFVRPSFKAEKKVYVTIIDINDNDPYFENLPYNASIREDLPINSYVYKVKAKDIDRKGSAELIYSIVGWTEASLFKIKPFDGTIWTNQGLDYEAKTSHLLKISVSDGRPTDPIRHTIYTGITIDIMDADDQGAKFDNYTYHADIPEGLHNFTNLVIVHARDLDKAINEPVTYGIDQTSNVGNYFRISDTTGQVTVTGFIDREEAATIFLRVTASTQRHSPAVATVIVNIVDINDNGPLFERGPYIGEVLENSLVGTTVMQVSANDKDSGNNSYLEYSIAGSDGKFSIGSGGYITVKENLDREKKDIYIFIVSAKEKFTTENYHNSTEVTVYIRDVNDNSPQFKRNSFQVYVKEEQQPKVFIVQINASDADVALNGAVTYSIIPDAEDRHKDFFIDPTNGSLYTANKLDREMINRYSLLIKATDNAPLGQKRQSICTVRITVTDINDNFPYFKEPFYTSSVTEAANPNTIVLALNALDDDDGTNSQLNYHIDNGNVNETFKIEYESGIIKTAHDLDREQIASYNLSIVVTDGGNKTSSTHVLVTVLDINDNSPLFESSGGYLFNVTEEVKDAYVGTVKALDIDEGDSGKIWYRITNNDRFNINASTGVISTKDALDRESVSLYDITVVAQDMSRTAPRNNYAQVRILVTDRNDNHPRFQEPKVYSALLRKDVIPGTIVYRFKATDADSGRNGMLTFNFLLEIPDFLNLNSSSGVLTVKKPIPTSINQTQTIEVVAYDSGIPVMNDTSTLSIFFANVFQNAPIIEPQVIKASVKEGIEKDHKVYDLNATYEGGSDESNYQYTILHGSEGKFRIESNTGMVTTTVMLDREFEEQYTLVMMVRFKGQNEANFATLVVSVEDINDNPPQFLQEYGTVYIEENKAVNTTILTLKATDLDKEENARISYLLKDVDDFKIDLTTGILMTAVPLDREKIPRYNISVMAVNGDAASPSLSVETHVIVIVQDMNDNVPRFVSSIYKCNVVENVVENTLVQRVNASDADQGINGRVLYHIDYTTSSQGSDSFTIERQTGFIRTTRSLDREKIDHYQLNLIATDQGVPPLSSNATLYITIEDIDDNHPYFDVKAYRLTPPENIIVGSVLGVFTTADDDHIPGQVYYTIHHGNEKGYFSMNSSTAVLTVKKELDRELESKYNLEIRAYSLSNVTIAASRRKRRALDLENHPFDTASVSIEVQDINDNPPEFKKSMVIAAVRHDAKYGTLVTRIFANDSDTGNNSGLFYQLVKGNEDSLVKLNENTGEINVHKSLVAESGKTIHFTVTAYDNYGRQPNNKATNELSVRIHVISDSQTAVIYVGVEPRVLNDNLDDFKRLLENLTMATVTIDKMESTSNKEMMLASFHAIDETHMQILSKGEIEKMILASHIKYVQDWINRWKISLYYPPPDAGAIKSSDEVVDKEIYIGIIAGITILFLITAGIAVWLAHVRKESREKEKSRRITPTESGRTSSRFYSNETIRSSKSSRYIIESYESRETEENSITAESSKEKVQVHGRRYYIDEDYKESMSDTADAGSMIDLDHSTNYFNDVDMMPSLNSSWAYIDKPELDNVEKNVDDLIDKKIANHSQEHPPAERQLSNREYFQSGNNEVMQLNLPSELPVMTSESVIPSQLVVTSQSMKTSDSAITTVSSLDVPVSKSPTPSWDYQDIQGYSDDDEQSQSQSSSRADVNDNVLQKNASQYIQGLPLNSRDEKSIDIESNEEVSFMVTYL